MQVQFPAINEYNSKDRYIYHPPHTSGFGSTVHGIVKATLFGMWSNRTVIRDYTHAYGKCPLRTPECYYLPGAPDVSMTRSYC
jgi:hypothetical protein